MKKLIILSLLLVTAPAFSQDVRKVFPEAEAVYINLSKEVEFFYSEGKLMAKSTSSEDLKLLTDNAAKMMSRGHVYHSSFNALKRWEAYGMSPEKKKLKIANTRTNDNRDDYIFFDDSKETSFDFPGITNGGTRHIEYEVEHSDVHLLSPFYIDRYFPVLNSEFHIVFPSNLKIKYVYKGLHADKISFTESRKKDKVTYSFKANNIPEAQNYPDAPDNSWFATHVIYFIEAIEENGVFKPYLATPADLYQYNYEHIRNLNKQPDEHLEALTDSLTKGLSSPAEKAKAIYSWVQTHIKYVAFEDGMEGFVPREAALVCSRRYGDCKDMASILTAMLKRADIPAYMTWIGTRSLSYSYKETPLPIVDNHMICTIVLDGKYIFLDGTDNGCIFGMPSSHIQGKEAMIAINENEYKILQVEIPQKERNQYSDSTFLEFNEKGLTGKVKITMSGYFTSNLRSAVSPKNEKERNDYFNSRFGRGNNKVKFSNWKFNINGNTSIITADIELPDYARKIGDEWMMNLNLFKWYEHQEIDFPKRKIPVSFPYLSTSNFTTVIKLPSGFKVSYQPKDLEYYNKVWGFNMKYLPGDGSISLTQQFDNNTLMLMPEDFESWNKVLENLFPQYNQSVVISK